MRLIDADAADVDKIMCYYSGHCRIEDVQEWLDDQPTIDAAPIVRCKDCALRGSVEDCPMCYEIERIWDVDGWDETTWETVDCTKDDGFCHEGRLELETD